MLITRPMKLAMPEDYDLSGTTSDGIYTYDELPAHLKNNADGNSTGGLPGVIHLGKLDGERARGATLLPLMDNASDNNTATVGVHRITPIVDRDTPGVPRAFMTELLYTLSVTASTLVYAAGKIGNRDIAYRACDTVVVSSTSDRAAHYETESGVAISVHSPGGNAQAVVSMTDLAGAWGIFLEPVGAGANEFNALVEPKT